MIEQGQIILLKVSLENIVLKIVYFISAKSICCYLIWLYMFYVDINILIPKPEKTPF